MFLNSVKDDSIEGAPAGQPQRKIRIFDRQRRGFSSHGTKKYEFSTGIEREIGVLVALRRLPEI
jgi:hypothetical protein